METTARFHALYETHYSAVVAYARRRAASPEDADDIVAETFTVAWRRLDAVPDGEAARPWLLRVAANCLANQRRGSRRRLRLVDRVGGDPVVTSGAHDGVERDDSAAEAAAVRSALARLRLDDAEILRLASWDDLTHAQIGQVLGISTNAVGIRLHRARKRLASELGLKGSATSGQVTVEERRNR